MRLASISALSDKYNTISFFRWRHTLVLGESGVAQARLPARHCDRDGGLWHHNCPTRYQNANRYVLQQRYSIHKIVLGSSNNSFEVDNVALAYTGSLTQGVPEASTWVMMILGFLSVGLVGYRRTGLSLRLV